MQRYFIKLATQRLIIQSNEMGDINVDRNNNNGIIRVKHANQEDIKQYIKYIIS